MAKETDTKTTEEKKAETQEAVKEKQLSSTLKKIKDTASEDDPKPSATVNLRTILGGDILTSELIRRQIWLFILIVAFIIAYVAMGYQCQQDMIRIDKLESDLNNAKFRALSESSKLTERSRESRVLETLKANKDSLLHISDQPPYIINVPEE